MGSPAHLINDQWYNWFDLLVEGAQGVKFDDIRVSQLDWLIKTFRILDK